MISLLGRTRLVSFDRVALLAQVSETEIPPVASVENQTILMGFQNVMVVLLGLARNAVLQSLNQYNTPLKTES